LRAPSGRLHYPAHSAADERQPLADDAGTDLLGGAYQLGLRVPCPTDSNRRQTMPSLKLFHEMTLAFSTRHVKQSKEG
jgi:hypothetical protein